MSTSNASVDLYDGHSPDIRLRVVIVGCGIGGLACAYSLQTAGHDVTVLESARSIGEIGAGIQVTPNLSRILAKWGLKSKLDEVAVVPEAFVFRRYKNGEKIGCTTWGSKMERDHGSPYYHIHRADLHHMLHGLAQEAGVTIRLSSHVQSIDPCDPSLKLSTGETIYCDLIVGADGVKSKTREVVIGAPDRPRPTGDAAYRATIPTQKMMGDPELEELVNHPELTAWLGPGGHVVGYCIRARKEYNLVLMHPDGRDGSGPAVESWTAMGSVEDMRRDFRGWEPRIEKMLQMIPSPLRWLLADREPLETWIHPDGKVALLGDACHPMLPYRAQGSAMAVEDAAVLGSLLARIRTLKQLPKLLKVYQDLRLPRTAQTQRSARLNQFIFHLPDGPEQEARDADMGRSMRWEEERLRRECDVQRDGIPVTDDPTWKGSANQWADKEKNRIQFGYDAYAAVEEWWQAGGRATIYDS